MTSLKRNKFPILNSIIPKLGLLCVAGSLGFNSATAATLVLDAIDDTYIQSDNGVDFFQKTTHGGENTLSLVTFGSRNPLMRFDTSGLGALAGGTINSVTLTFTIASGSLTSASNLQLIQLTNANSDWVEGTGTGFGNSTPGADNFVRSGVGNSGNAPAATGTPWAGTNGAAGGTNTDTSGLYFDLYDSDKYQGNAAAVYDLGGVASVGSTLTLTLSNSVITNWMSDSTAAMAGLGLFNIGNGGNVDFRSTEAGSGAPTITVDYTGVPEPSSYMLMGLGMVGAAIVYSRRRLAKV